MIDCSHKFPVEKMCKVFEVSRSGYYKWKNRLTCKQTKTASLNGEIRYEYEKSRGTYGSPRVSQALARRDVICSKSTVARRMKKLKLVARKKRKYKITTQSNHKYKVAPNLLDRQFDVALPATAWVSDITYIRVASHWAYLTVIIDLADRMVVGWSLSSNMSTENTVIKAFEKASAFRKPSDNLIFHSDRGIQYACNEFKTILQHKNIRQSMSAKGDCWDNAVAESFFKTIKVEELYDYRFSSLEQVYSVVFNYINGWYNTVRIHSALKGKSPLETFSIKSKYLYAA